MPDGGIFDSAGFHVPDLAAGLSGGIVRSLFAKEGIVQILTSALGGALTANYLAGPFSALVGNIVLRGEPLSRDVSAFVVGLTAMTICQQLITRVGSLAQQRLRGGTDV